MTSKIEYTEADRKWMSLALEIAERGAGYVSPNPMAGCVIVSGGGKKIGQGYHERYGQAHAEVNAVKSIKNKAQLKGATVYVTLEPCSHHGNTPPCCEMLGALPIERVVAAMGDPTSKVNGKGIRYLRKKGIQVDVGLMEEKAKQLNEFFLHYHIYNRPFVTLKMAQTADGYIAAPNGDSKWISGEGAQKRVHEWRSRYDAVMVGRNTALLDNPRLTVRHVEGRQPRRIVIDGNFELPRELNLFTDQYEEKTIIVTHNRKKFENETDAMLTMLQSNYFRGKTILVPRMNGHSDLESAMKEFAEMEITSVLVEAGQSLATALLKQRLADKLELFIAPKLLGGGTRGIIGLGVDRINEIIELKEHHWQQVGDDILLTGYLN